MFNFGERLRQIRREKNLTQRQLADLIGSTERGVQHYESGERKPGLDVVLSILDNIDVSADYLLGKEKDVSAKIDTELDSSKPFVKTGKIQIINLDTPYADEKINAMLQTGWKILDKYSLSTEDYPHHCSTRLYYVLGHEAPDAQIPLTEREIREHREHEERLKRVEEDCPEWTKEDFSS